MIEVRTFWEGHVADERFPLTRYLGGDEHGAVFLTEYAGSPDQKAAIKLIPAPPGSSEEQLTRWRLATKFSHPALLRIFHAGRCTLDNSSMLYVVMEYAEENLAEILSERPLSPQETRDLLAPVLDALGYLHGKGFVHARVHPSNVMAIGDQVKLSSDGIRRIGESPARKNGNARYAAPESSPGGLSTASDVWSLGMTLVECLTQHLPSSEPGSRDVPALPPDLPAPFSELARHCLNPSPQRRWNVADLQSLLERKPAVAEPQPQPVRRQVPEQSSAKPRLLLPLPAVGLAGIALLVALAVFFIHELNPSRTPLPAHSPAPSIAQSPAAQSDAIPAKAENTPAPQPATSGSSGSLAAETHAAAPPPAPALHTTRASGRERGGIERRVLPHVRSGAAGTIWGTVRVGVRVQVDPSGNVVGAQFDSRGPSPYFAGLSMDAARNWKFRPPAGDVNNFPSEWVISFSYTRDATTASAVEQNP